MCLSAGKSISIFVTRVRQDAKRRHRGLDWILTRFQGEPTPSTTIFCGYLDKGPQRALTSATFFNIFFPQTSTRRINRQ
jgi:hypothetical protein